MLIGTFQIEIGRESQRLVATQAGLVRDTGVEPDIQRIANLAVVCRLWTQEYFGIEAEPCIDTRLRDTLRHLFKQRCRIRMQRLGLTMDEKRDGHPPGSLSRYAPVRAILNHATNSLTSPIGRELHAIDRP